MQKKGWIIIIGSLVLFTFLVLFIALAKSPTKKAFNENNKTAMNTGSKSSSLLEPTRTESGNAKHPDFQKTEWVKPAQVRGVYTTGWIAGSSKWFPRLVKFIDETEINSLVVDIKNDSGNLSFMADVPLAKTTHSAVKMIADPEALIKTLKEHDIYPIARIVVFKDPFIAKAKPEWAVKDSAGGLWRDRKGLYWIDPYNKAYWDYIVEIAKAAVGLGFQEIQFDYVRFTSDGNTKHCVYSFSNGKAAEDVIQDFLKYAKEKLSPYKVPVSADIFGLTVSADADLGIGQRFEKIVSQVDLVCPMVYPSHYIRGNFGLKNPNANPYQTVFHGVSDAKKRLAQAGNTTTQVRPWLQDFSLGVHYGKPEIQAQIQAVKDAGVKEWIFWNPSCRYNIEKYR